MGRYIAVLNEELTHRANPLPWFNTNITDDEPQLDVGMRMSRMQIGVVVDIEETFIKQMGREGRYWYLYDFESEWVGTGQLTLILRNRIGQELRWSFDDWRYFLRFEERVVGEDEMEWEAV